MHMIGILIIFILGVLVGGFSPALAARMRAKKRFGRMLELKAPNLLGVFAKKE